MRVRSQLGLVALTLLPLVLSAPPEKPTGRLISRVGDRSVVIHWDQAPLATGAADAFEFCRIDSPGEPPKVLERGPSPHFADLKVINQRPYAYFVRLGDGASPIAFSPTLPVTAKRFTNDVEFLELLQATAFDFFWYEVNPANGLIRDRNRPDSFCSIAAVGFGLTAIGIGIDHGWITREQGRQRTLLTLRTFAYGSQGPEPAGRIGHRGWFYHFLDPTSATRYRQVELSTIDTALFLAGALHAHQYFDSAHPEEAMIRHLAQRLVEGVDWAWMCPEYTTLSMGWHPESGFIQARWVGYNEAMILYILGLGTARNPLPMRSWAHWTRGYRFENHHGFDFVNFPPLFGHQYSHCWIDFREAADPAIRAYGLTYFENSRRATLAQRAYAMLNPQAWPGYGADQWGFTACDGPGRAPYQAYAARGTPPPEHDDGTLAPTAAGGSLPFAPQECLAVLRQLYQSYREKLWTPYGFRDAFNLAADWWGPDVIGIDQGPILIMAENYRTGRVWQRMIENETIRRGLERAGFRPLPPPPRRPSAKSAAVPTSLARPDR